MTDPTTGANEGAGIGWGRAIVSGVAILIVGLVTTVWVADMVLKKMTSLSRDRREYLASFIFLTVLIVIAWALRRLQHRGVI